MARRCEFLEKFTGFLYNGGLGSGLTTNSVLLGSTLIEVMIKEAVQMSEKFDYQHSRENIQQVLNVHVITANVHFDGVHTLVSLGPRHPLSHILGVSVASVSI